MAASNRLQKEYFEVKESNLNFFRAAEVKEYSILQWEGLLVPDRAPYKNAAFKVLITFPPEYPFKPPKVKFDLMYLVF